MAGYTFANREDAVLAIRMARKKKPLPGSSFTNEPYATEGFIFFTPSGGIAARSGTTPGSAECTPWLIDMETGELEEMLDAEDQSQESTVYHIGSTAVAGNTFIQAKRIYGVLVADMEDC